MDGHSRMVASECRDAGVRGCTAEEIIAVPDRLRPEPTVAKERQPYYRDKEKRNDNRSSMQDERGAG